ncbi:MAG: SUMF1/EgtB/PvdO family nonheme iron enzyme [Spirochaetia bacterium]
MKRYCLAAVIMIGVLFFMFTCKNVLSPLDPSGSERIFIPTLTASPIRNAASYQFQIAEGTDFTTGVVWEDESSISIIQPSGISLQPGEYSWRVRSKPADEGWSEWSEAAAFTMTDPFTSLSPEDGTEKNDVTPTFDWNDVTGAVNYELQISQNESAINGGEIIPLDESTYTPSQGMVMNSPLYWRIRAINADGQPSAWSTTRSFTIVIGSIQDRFPPDGASLLDTTPEITWADIAGAVSYEFQYGTVEDDLPDSDKFELTESTYTPDSALNDNTTYYWRVRGINSEDSATAWSLVYSFRIGFKNMTPQGGELVTDTTPMFDWDDVIGAESYELKFAASTVDLETAATETLEESSFTPDTYLNNLDATYFWQIRAANSDGEFGAWSDIESFGVWWGELSGLSPEHDSATSDTTPTFEWDPVPGAVLYEIHVVENPNDFTSDFSGAVTVTTNSYTPSAYLTNLQAYYWRVRAKDADGQYGPISSPPSDPWLQRFTLHIYWGEISGMSPENDSYVNDTTPTMEWDPVPGAASYEVISATTYDGLGSANPVSVSLPSYTYPNTLVHGDTLHWEVQAVDSDGQYGPDPATKSMTIYIPGTVEIYTPSDYSFNMIAVPPYEDFPAGTDDDGTETVSDPFQIADTEVTYELWYEVYSWATQQEEYYTFANQGQEGHDGTDGAEPSETPQEPVTNISWRDAMVWCNALTAWYNWNEEAFLMPVYYTDSGYTQVLKSVDATGISYPDPGGQDDPYVHPTADGFRLPAAAEWELAARRRLNSTNTVAGFSDPWFTRGDSASGATSDHTDSNATGDVAWYLDNSTSTSDVAQKTANSLGLYDMSGNVGEWCFDWAAAGYERVTRGGNYSGSASLLRVGYENGYSPASVAVYLGFRFVRSDQ